MNPNSLKQGRLGFTDALKRLDPQVRLSSIGYVSMVATISLAVETRNS